MLTNKKLITSLMVGKLSALSRGANGVILIITKKSKVAGTSLNVNVYTGAGKVTRKFDLMNTEQYLAMRREAFNNDGLNVGATDYDLNGKWDTAVILIGKKFSLAVQRGLLMLNCLFREVLEKHSLL
jgi:hypothetical protein